MYYIVVVTEGMFALEAIKSRALERLWYSTFWMRAQRSHCALAQSLLQVTNPYCKPPKLLLPILSSLPSRVVPKSSPAIHDNVVHSCHVGVLVNKWYPLKM